MSQYKSAFFKITAKTNMHVGSGSNDYGIIDNLIQRDHITELPVINSSSLKGALRAFCEFYELKEINSIFGAKVKDTEDKEDAKKKEEQTPQAGQFRFFDAKFLAMPIRCGEFEEYKDCKKCKEENATLKEGDSSYEMVTSKAIKDELVSDFNLFDYCEKCKEENSSDKMVTSKGIEGELEFENKSCEDCKIKVDHITSTFMTVCNDCLKKMADNYHLPVIARNQLDNGESKNLWYEQVMPRESQFYFRILYPDNKSTEFEKFRKIVTSNMVQIGANASIGYGFCKIELIEE